jgi:hypothetical protein
MRISWQNYEMIKKSVHYFCCILLGGFGSSEYHGESMLMDNFPVCRCKLFSLLVKKRERQTKLEQSSLIN